MKRFLSLLLCLLTVAASFPLFGGVTAVFAAATDETDTTGLYWESGNLMLTPAGVTGSGMRMVTLADGNTIMAAYSFERNANIRKSYDDGETWTDAVQVSPSSLTSTTLAGAKGLATANPFLFVENDGTVWLTYRGTKYIRKSTATDNSGDSDYYTALFISKSTDNGETWGDPIEIAGTTVYGVPDSNNSAGILGLWEPYICYIPDPNNASGETIAIYYMSDAVDNGSSITTTFDTVSIFDGTSAPLCASNPTMPSGSYQRVICTYYNTVTSSWVTPFVTLHDDLDTSSPVGSRDGMAVITKLNDGNFAMIIESTRYNPWLGYSNYSLKTAQGNHNTMIQIAFSQDGITWTPAKDLSIPATANQMSGSPYIVTLPSGRVAICYQESDTQDTIKDGNLIYNAETKVLVSDTALTYDAGAAMAVNLAKGVKTASGFTASTFNDKHNTESLVECGDANDNNGYAIWPSLYMHKGYYLFAIAGTGYKDTNDADGLVSTPLRFRRAIADAKAITDASDFFAMTSTGNYLLMNDINLGGNATAQTPRMFADFTEASTPNYTALPASIDNPFRGNFAGNGYEISGLYIDTTSDENARLLGLFGSTNGAVINDLTVSGTVAGVTKGSFLQCTGGFIGHAVNTTIRNCVSNVTITGGANYVSGFCGYACSTDGKSMIIDNCVNNGAVTANGHKSGIAGFIELTASGASCIISNCENSATATITAGSSFTGGIVGVGKHVIIKNCVNRADIYGSTGQYIAGIAGYISGQAANGNAALNTDKILNCVNYGKIDSTNAGSPYMGGIAGMAYSVGTLEIIGCRNEGIISTVTGSYTAGIVGFTKNNSINSTDEYSVLIKGCVNNGSVLTSTVKAGTASALYVGGIIGFADTAATGTSAAHNAPIAAINCVNNGAISGYAYIGGISGMLKTTNAYNSIIIKDCLNTADITSGTTYAGGISGRANANLTPANGGLGITFDSCANYGDINAATNYSGGITGETALAVFIYNCYNAGNISSGTNFSGGILGNSGATFTSGGSKMMYNINVGTVTSAGANKAPIGAAATISSGAAATQVKDNYYLDTTSTTTLVSANDHAMSDAQMKSDLSQGYTALDFDIWGYEAGRVPFIQSLKYALNPNTSANVRFVDDDGAGDGRTPDSPMSGFTAAMNELDALGGGTLVIVGKFDFPAYWTSPDTITNHITITSAYDGVDYRYLGTDRVGLHYSDIAARTVFSSDITFEYIDIYYTSTTQSPTFYCNFNRVTMGYDVNCISTDEAAGKFPSICLGYFLNYTATAVTEEGSSYSGDDAVLTINSGKWWYIYGGNRTLQNVTKPYGNISADTYVIINGGFIDGNVTRLSVVGNNNMTGNATLIFNAGTYNAAYLFATPALASPYTVYNGYDVSGNINIIINGGTFTSASFRVREAQTENANCDRDNGGTFNLYFNGGTINGGKNYYNSELKASQYGVANPRIANVFTNSDNITTVGYTSNAALPFSTFSAVNYTLTKNISVELPAGTTPSDVLGVTVNGNTTGNYYYFTNDGSTYTLHTSAPYQYQTVTPSSNTVGYTLHDPQYANENSIQVITSSNASGKIYTFANTSGELSATANIAALDDALATKGFAVRIDNDPGIRFSALVPNTVQALSVASDNCRVLEYGILVKATDNDTKLEYFASSDATTTIGKSYYTAAKTAKSVSYDVSDSTNTYLKLTENSEFQFTCVLMNSTVTDYSTSAASEYFNTPFTFRAYILCSDGTNSFVIYGDEYTRTVGQVSNQAQELGYTGELIDAAATAWNGIEY